LRHKGKDKSIHHGAHREKQDMEKAKQRRGGNILWVVKLPLLPSRGEGWDEGVQELKADR